MGLLGDLVVAPAADAERVAQATVPSEAFGGIDISTLARSAVDSGQALFLWMSL